MARYLIVAHHTAASPELIERVTAMRADDPQACFVILVPASVTDQLVPVWEEGEVRERARARARQALGLLLAAGVDVVAARIGDASPLQAVDDELCGGADYAGIVLSTFPPGISRWLRGDLVGRMRRRFGLPVVHVVASSSSQLLTA
jgi:hypothetical protein